MARHINKDIALLVCEESFRTWRGRIDSTCTKHANQFSYTLQIIVEHSCQKPDEVLDIYFVATIINLNIVSIEVDGVRLGRVNSGGKLVSRIARDVVCKHENDIRVGNTQTFYCSVPIGWRVLIDKELALIGADKKRTSRECWPYAAGTGMSVLCLI